MPNPRRIVHSSHWGSFQAEIEGDRFKTAIPFDGDPAPSPIIHGMPDALYSDIRIDRPYVRKGWLDGDRRGGSLRGGDPFVPVSWDMAIRLVGEELARVRAEVGSEAIFGGGTGWSSAGRFHHAKSQLQRMLAATGGYTGSLTNYSYGAGMTLMPHLVGDYRCVEGPLADWADICRNAKLMLCFGGLVRSNGQVLAGGGGRHENDVWLTRAVAAGIRIVHISPIAPELPEGMRPDAVEWIPIRPNTDTAVLLAIAHTLVASDRVDHDFLDRCTTGFDAYRNSLLAEGRTPEWAEGVSGIPASVIRELAASCHELPTMLTASWSLQRAEYGEQPYWALFALACLLGGIGKPGVGFSFGYGSAGGLGSSRARVSSFSLPQLRNSVDRSIPAARLTDMLLHPGEPYHFNGQRRVYPDIRMIYWAGGNPFHHHQDLNRLLPAWARVETIISHEPWWTALARHSDIVLPATTTMERNDIASSPRDRFLIAMKRISPPIGQSRSDFDMLADIAEVSGNREAFTEGRGEMDWLRAMFDAGRGAAAKAGIDMPDFDRFWEAGAYEIPAPTEPTVPYASFVKDPQANPLPTASGRLEIFSERIAGFGYDDCPGIPKWFEHDEYLGSPKARTYPLHLLSGQPATRLHSQLDSVGLSAASKISGREPLTMNVEDARERNLADGDIVRIHNARGACLAGLVTSTRIMRGVIFLPTGAWFDPLVPGAVNSLCVHGNPNVLTQDRGTSQLAQGSSAQSCLVDVEKWTADIPPVKVHKRPEISNI